MPNKRQIFLNKLIEAKSSIDDYVEYENIMTQYEKKILLRDVSKKLAAAIKQYTKDVDVQTSYPHR